MGGPSADSVKDGVKDFWEQTPCGTRGIEADEGSRAFFDRIEREREEREPFIARFARFGERRGQQVLEVGIGAGTDFVRFARAGARLSGVDLTDHAVQLAQRRLALERLEADVRRADVEHLPFPDDSFDFVYSWGVIHHTPDPVRAAAEIVRVSRPGGEICVMVYHRHSLVALQCWLLYGLLRARPWRSLTEVIAHHVESPGTHAYSLAEARGLFPGLERLQVTPVATVYDVRLTRSLSLRPLLTLLPDRFGWFLVVRGFKPPVADGFEAAGAA
jgi:ubiquinone/menaquinone biosynthesis C-methylase UbiE